MAKMSPMRREEKASMTDHARWQPPAGYPPICLACGGSTEPLPGRPIKYRCTKCGCIRLRWQPRSERSHDEPAKREG
jgi:hypothetical protein